MPLPTRLTPKAGFKKCEAYFLKEAKAAVLQLSASIMPENEQDLLFGDLYISAIFITRDNFFSGYFVNSLNFYNGCLGISNLF